MKKILSVILVFILLSICVNMVCYADSGITNANETTLITLRAGGGGSGGGGSSSHSGGGSGRPASLLERIINTILFPFVFFFSSIVFYFKLFKRSRKAKQLMKQMSESDNAWKYENLTERVEESFYAIQNAWTNLDMTPAREYMSYELLDSFQTKLNWMELRQQKNILKNIKLISALPVAVYDDIDNDREHVWFYIKGKMIDYTVNVNTNEKLDGNVTPSSFIEYWQYIRRDNIWVLNKILQKNESDQIVFSE